MEPPYEWQIGLRYTRADKRTTDNGIISFLALTSARGNALGVAALIVVLSVMNGLKVEVRDRMLSVLAHVEIFSPAGPMPNWRRTADESLQNPAVTGAAPYIDAQVLVASGGKVVGVVLRGIDSQLESQVSDVAKDMKSGHLTDLVPGELGTALGSALATNPQAHIGDRLTFFPPVARRRLRLTYAT